MGSRMNERTFESPDQNSKNTRKKYLPVTNNESFSENLTKNSHVIIKIPQRHRHTDGPRSTGCRIQPQPHTDQKISIVSIILFKKLWFF